LRIALHGMRDDLDVTLALTLPTPGGFRLDGADHLADRVDLRFRRIAEFDIERDLRRRRP
jgi:hypothetical protein